MHQGLPAASSLGFATLMAAGGPVGALARFLLAASIAAALAVICPFFTGSAAIVAAGFLLFTCIHSQDVLNPFPCGPC